MWAAAWATISAAQSEYEWSAPYLLSTKEGRPSEGYMVADNFGHVHVFWIETELPDGGSVIQHARFDGEVWTPATDIFVSRQITPIGFLSPFVDQQGLVHLVWSMSNFGPVCYMNAPAHDTPSAKRWSDPVCIDLPAFRGEMQVDSRGTIHLLSADFYGRPGVYYTRSEDGGNSWSPAAWLDPHIPPDHAPLDIKIAQDEAGNLHAAWHYLNLEANLGGPVYYAHSLDGGASWSTPISIDDPDESADEVRMARPGIVTQGQTVHIIWAGTARTNREHRYSTDAGLSWTDSTRIFGDLHGQAAGDGLAVDGAGQIHFVSNIRHPLTIWHSYWDGDHWTDLVPASDAFPKAHYVRLVVRAGNQLVMTFTPNSQRDALYAMYRTLSDVSVVAAQPTPVPSSESLPEAFVATDRELLGSTSTSAALRIEDSSSQPLAGPESPSSQIWLGIAPALLLLIGIGAFQVLRKRISGH